MPPSDEELFTTKELAAKFKVTTYTIRQWIIAGKFPNAMKINARDHRIPKSDVESLIQRMYGGK